MSAITTPTTAQSSIRLASTSATFTAENDALDALDGAAGVRTCNFPGCTRPAAEGGRRGRAGREYLYCDDLAHTSRAARDERERRDGQSALASSVTEGLAYSGKWEQWQQVEPRLAGFASFDEACAAWRRRDDDCYPVVAALTVLGSRRGGDDDDAALAVLVLLAEGVNRVAGQLSDLCEVGDVHATVWEEIKRAEPQLGNRAGRYLLDRARQRLCRQADAQQESKRPDRFRTTSLEGWIARNKEAAVGEVEGDDPIDLALAMPVVEDPVEDLSDLLCWARNVGVIAVDEIDLLVELMATEHEVLARGETKRAREEAQRIVGERHGVTMRQIRRRRDRTAARLAEAAPRYLEAIA
ncbi:MULTISPECIES: hypothetical protein [unclassified Nocardioides]|uniref:hypothetical protein n=1 Tax=unclassified Nocardioides TaxID=2615069 RepID=UPI0009F056D5|nr:MULTISPECIES: hypothetical protein [unclassified Nocardioides]GAW52562.1 uncharacterized protein PD653B2_4920 [Nocardioides sp. PD653-B2]GAW55599.1 uncharacterized protein PD653_3024 [Nocardioides sp. PD653]